MILAFTGPSELTVSRELAVMRRLKELVDTDDTWRSGCAFGVDTVAASQALINGIAYIELYVPAAPHNDELVVAYERENFARIVYCGNAKEPYRHRNEVMVKGKLGIAKADRLIAFVKSPVYYRSGEWMTINIARRAKVDIDLNVV